MRGMRREQEDQLTPSCIGGVEVGDRVRIMECSLFKTVNFVL